MDGPPSEEWKTWRKPRTFGRTLLGGLILVATFGASLLGSTLLHVNTKPARRFTANLLSDVLSQTFRGKIVIHKIDRISEGGFDGADATAYDPVGVPVLKAYGLRGRASLLDIARRIATDTRHIEIDIAQARAERVEVIMGDDAQGIPTIARTFEPRPSDSPSTGPSPVVRVWLPQIELHRANVKGTIGGMSGIDADLANVYGSVLAGSERTSILVRRFSLQGGGLVAKPIHGTAETRIEVPSPTGKAVSVWSVFDGSVGDVQVNLRGHLDGSELFLTGDALRARPEDVRELLPWWPAKDDAKIHVQARGEPPDLFARGSIAIGSGDAEFAGQLGFKGGIHTSLAVEARDINLRSFAEEAPPTAISASATVNLAVDPTVGLKGSIEGTTGAFDIVGFEVPGASVTANIAGPRLDGKVVLHDRAYTSDIDVDVHPGVAGPVVVDLDWTGRTPAMERVRWLADVGQGELSWRAKGSIVDGRLQAFVDGTTSNFRRPGVELVRGRVTGTVRGPIATPAVDLSLEGQGFSVGPLAFPEVLVKAEGPLGRLAIGAAVAGPESAKLGAKAVVETAAGRTVVHDIELAAARGDVAVYSKVRAVAVSDERIDLDGISIEGAGAPIAGQLSISPSKVKVHVAATDVDLKRIGAVLLPGAILDGHAAFDVDAELGHGTERGHARIKLEKGRLGEIEDVTAHAEADISEGKFSGGVDLIWGTIGSATVTTSDAVLAGSAVRASSWENAHGKLQVDSAIDLGRLSDQFAALLGSFGSAGGAARAKLLVSRDAEDKDAPKARGPVHPPDVDLLFWTDGLRVGKKRDAAAVTKPAEGFESDGVEVQIAAHVTGDAPDGQISARLIDAEGIFAGLSARSNEVRLADFFRDPDHAIDRITRLPMNAEVTIPRRNLAVYPSFARLPGWRGEVEGAATMTGTIRKPMVSAHVQGHTVEPANAGLGLPIDVDAQGRYDGARALARLSATRPEGVVFDAMTQIDAPLDKVLAGVATLEPKSRRREDPAVEEAPGTPWWQATGRARLYSLPLGSVPSLAENGVGGFASGILTFRGLNRDPEVSAQIEAANLSLDTAIFPNATAQLQIAKGRIVVSTKVDQKEGGASATASGGVRWDSPIVPGIDKKSPLDFFVEARDLRAAALYPLFLRKLFSHFDGHLDGTMHVHQAAEGDEAPDEIDGSFELHDGTLLIPEIGQEFRKGSAHLTVSKRGEVVIDNVSASGVTGRLTAAGRMMLKGLGFESAEGEIRITQKEAMPLTLEGVSIGDAWGTLMLHAKMSDDHTVKLDVDVPVLHVDVPESSSRDVQALPDHPDVTVGIRKPGEALAPLLLSAPEEPRDEDALAWHVTFYLGQDVVIRRGSMMQLPITGKPVVDLTDKAHVTGEVELRGGTVDVFGKRFEIEHGTAEFDGDEPGNPNVSVTARWDAPDGTRIYADFVGRIRTGLFALRSTPARSQSEILGALVYGTTGDAALAPGSAYRTQKTAADTAGSVAVGSAVSTNVNKVLASVTPLDITTRMTSDAQSPTPEVAVRLSPKVSAQVSYRTRAPLPTEKQDRMLLTLDWRFLRNWSIASTVGDKGGSSVDLIWKYRY